MRRNNAASSAAHQHALIWIPGSYAPVLSEKRNSFLRLLKNKGFKEERMTKVRLYTMGTSTTPESNKSLNGLPRTHRSLSITGWRTASGTSAGSVSGIPPPSNFHRSSPGSPISPIPAERNCPSLYWRKLWGGTSPPVSFISGGWYGMVSSEGF